MKTEFPGYFKLNTDQIKKLWKTAIFVFDANILLGFYRYSEKTRDEFFSVLDLLRERCWLPHQAATEYFRNRLSVIGQQQDAYVEMIKDIEKVEDRFKAAHQHPFLSDGLLKRLCEDFTSTKAELQKSLEYHTKRASDDDILERIDGLFSSRLGVPFPKEKLDEIYKEGGDRYKLSIPPGYKDFKKADSDDSNRQFGDLVLWKQILNKARADKCGIIFVCDDKKEDWWMQFRGQTIGPRPELIKEFKLESKTDFHMYTSDRFLEFGSVEFGRKVSEATVTEMRELKRMDDEERSRIVRYRRRMREVDALSVQLEEEQMALLKLIDSLESDRNFIIKRADEIRRTINVSDPVTISTDAFNRLDDITRKLSVIDGELVSAKTRFDELGMRMHVIRQRDMKLQQGDAPNPHAFGTFRTSAAEQPWVPKAGEGG